MDSTDNKKKSVLQAIILLSIAIAFCICTIIFGKDIPMVIVFGSITIAFIISGIITLLIKHFPKKK